jgi:anti-sigma factor RsiW
MTCELWRDQVEAYIDGELASSHEAEVAMHLRGCPDCNAFAAESIRLKRAVSTTGRRYQPSAGFRQQLMLSIGARPERRRIPWMSFAFAAMLLVAVALTLFSVKPRHTDTARELADLHLNALSSSNPVDVVSTDMHTVKPWFEGKLPFSFNLPDLAGSPFTLLGGRVAYVHGTPCAQLLFTYRLHRISTLIGPANVISGDTRELPNGLHLVRTEKNGYAYATIGDAGLDTIQDLSRRMEAVQN